MLIRSICVRKKYQARGGIHPYKDNQLNETKKLNSQLSTLKTILYLCRGKIIYTKNI